MNNDVFVLACATVNSLFPSHVVFSWQQFSLVKNALTEGGILHTDMRSCLCFS